MQINITQKMTHQYESCNIRNTDTLLTNGKIVSVHNRNALERAGLQITNTIQYEYDGEKKVVHTIAPIDKPVTIVVHCGISEKVSYKLLDKSPTVPKLPRGWEWWY